MLSCMLLMINITISNLCDVLNTRTMNHPIWAKHGPISDSLHRGTPFQFQFQWIPLLIRTLKGYTNVSMLCASLACSQPKDDRNGNENVKRAIDLDQQNNNSARTAGFFVHLFAVTAWLRPWNSLTERFTEDVNSPQLIFLSPSKLGLGPQETSSEKISLHLALKASWNNLKKNFEEKRKLFYNDAFAAVTVVVAKAP